MFLVGVVVTSLYSCMTMGFATIKSARDNERASQILLEKFEAIRLYTWEQINSNGFIPTTFSAIADPQLTNTNQITYSGTITITNSPVAEAYGGDLRLVTVQVSWPYGSRTNTRSMKSLVARYGLQNYIY